VRILEDQVGLVTGSSRGIGAAIAKTFAQHGARVAVHGRDASAVDAVRADIANDGGRALGVVGDVTVAAELATMRAQIEAELGPVDIVVANAGGNPSRPVPVDELTEATWRATIDGNLTATFLTIQCFLPAMKQRGAGVIVTISSAAARRPTAKSPIAYAAAKAGIELLTQEVAQQMGPFGIRANCIAPEIILTERNDHQIPPDIKTALIAEHPIRRLGTPQDVANAALYLASPLASWVSGIVLDVAGGAVVPR
jgi:3-oxoacyl-[acyl-carrier protein] reductase